MGRWKFDVQSKTYTEVGSIWQGRQRKTARGRVKQAKARKFKTPCSARILVCIRHTVTDLSKYFFLTCPPPQLLAWAAGLISVDSAKTTSVRLESSAWYAPGGLWCLITFSVWGPVHLSNRIRHIPILPCTLISPTLKVNKACSIGSSCRLPLSLFQSHITWIYLVNQFPRLIHGPSENYLFPLLTLRQIFFKLALNPSLSPL